MPQPLAAKRPSRFERFRDTLKGRGKQFLDLARAEERRLARSHYADRPASSARPGLGPAAQQALDQATPQLFEADVRVYGVGLSAEQGRHVLVASRDRTLPVAHNYVPKVHDGDVVEGLTVRFRDTDGPPLAIPPDREAPSREKGAGAHSEVVALQGASASRPEQRCHRPLVCGIEIQNHTCDSERGLIRDKKTSVGTLGCFVLTSDNRVAALSNEHVLQATYPYTTRPVVITQNRTVDAPRDFRIGCGPRCPDPIRFAPAWITDRDLAASPQHHNQIDAAYVKLDKAHFWRMNRARGFRQSLTGYHLGFDAGRNFLSQPADPLQDAPVFKVGRTTGLTHGRVAEEVTNTLVLFETVTGSQKAFFTRVFRVVSTEPDGRPFSLPGDSGSLIVSAETHRPIGLLFAGRGGDTYGCRLDLVLKAADCELL